MDVTDVTFYPGVSNIQLNAFQEYGKPETLLEVIFIGLTQEDAEERGSVAGFNTQFVGQ